VFGELPRSWIVLVTALVWLPVLVWFPLSDGGILRRRRREMCSLCESRRNWFLWAGAAFCTLQDLSHTAPRNFVPYFFLRIVLGMRTLTRTGNEIPIVRIGKCYRKRPFGRKVRVWISKYLHKYCSEKYKKICIGKLIQQAFMR